MSHTLFLEEMTSHQQLIPQMEQAHLWLPKSPWFVGEETSFEEVLDIYRPGKSSQKPNRLENLWQIPYP